MTHLAALLKSVRSRWISPAEIRAETWALGARHRGDVLEGARIELNETGISSRRSILLKAVIRSLRSKR